MSDETIRKIIEQRIQNNWSDTPIDWDNIKYIPTNGVSFISPIISENEPERKSSGCLRRNYTVVIEIRTPKNKGTALISNYADSIKDLFQDYSEGNFICLKSHTQRVGNSASQWHQRNVILSCRYNDYK